MKNKINWFQVVVVVVVVLPQVVSFTFPAKNKLILKIFSLLIFTRENP